MDKSWRRMSQAFELGPLARLRLRAECLLERIADKQQGLVTLSQADIDQLDRIAVAPKVDDAKFLGGFDWIYERDEKNAQN